MTSPQANYYELALRPFVQQMAEKHYQALHTLCAGAEKQAEKVMRQDMQHSTSQYAQLCKTMLAETANYVQIRAERFVPYLLSLSQKAIEKHDCGTCAGGCKVGHDMHLTELQATNQRMQAMLGKIKMVTLPLYSDTIYPQEYDLLRKQMALLEVSLTELLYLESNYLVPKIIAAQKSINAGS